MHDLKVIIDAMALKRSANVERVNVAIDFEHDSIKNIEKSFANRRTANENRENKSSLKIKSILVAKKGN